MLITTSRTTLAMHALQIAPLVRPKQIVHPFFVLLVTQQLGLMPLI